MESQRCELFALHFPVLAPSCVDNGRLRQEPSMAAAGTTNADEVLHVRVIACASSSHIDKVMHYGTAGDGIVM